MEDNNLEQKLRQIARRRVTFKRSLTTYFLVNSFLCVIWYITIGKNGGHFWPVWSIITWGVALAFQYMNAYNNTGSLAEEEEYNKLKSKM